MTKFAEGDASCLFQLLDIYKNVRDYVDGKVIIEMVALRSMKKHEHILQILRNCTGYIK